MSEAQEHEFHPFVLALAHTLHGEASGPAYSAAAIERCVADAASVDGDTAERIVIDLFALAIRGTRIMGAEGRLAVGQLLETAARVARRARAAGTLSDDRLSRLGAEHLRVLGEQKRSVTPAAALRAPVRGVGLRRLG